MPSLVTIAILTLVTIAFVIIFGVLRIVFTKPDIKVPDEIVAPISPTLDKTTLDKVASRLFFAEGQIPQTVISSPTPLPTETPTAAPTATGSAIPTATASASPIP